MIGRKEGKYLTFTFDDGKQVKYDLSTGDSIGVRGNPVKSVSYKMKDISIHNAINSIDNANYRRFLRDVRNKEDCESTRTITNFGTLLRKVNNYSILEQYYAMGLYNVDFDLRVPANKCPKIAIKICRDFNVKLDNNLVFICEEYPDYAQTAFYTDFITLSKQQVLELLTCYHYGDNDRFEIFHIVKKYNYNFKALMMYLDRLYTYEAIDNPNILREISDYLKMVSYISNKYDKFPRNFLTTHKIAIRNYHRFKTEYDEYRFESLMNKDMEYCYGEYIFITPLKVSDIKDEAVQQNNCVVSYIDRVIDGKCYIMFMRYKDTPNKSLVTLEIADNKVVQSRRAYNADITKEDEIAIKKYEEYLNRRFNKNKESAA